MQLARRLQFTFFEFTTVEFAEEIERGQKIMSQFQKILVHVDSRQVEHPSLDVAIEIAKSHQAELKIVDILPDITSQSRMFPGETKHIADEVSKAKSHKLEGLCDKAQTSGVTTRAAVLPAPTSLGLISEAMRGEYDLLIKETKGKASRMWGVFGTTATRLLRHCPCPTLLVRPGLANGQFKNVVAAVDATFHDETYSELNERIIAGADAICRPDYANFDIVTAWIVQSETLLRSHMNEEEFELLCERTEAHAKSMLDDLTAKAEGGGRAENVRLFHGDAAEQVTAFVNENNIDLLVLGTIGRSGIAGLLMGNSAERILDKVECSVLAVKPEGFESTIHLPD